LEPVQDITRDFSDHTAIVDDKAMFHGLLLTQHEHVREPGLSAGVVKAV
jgi:hypothetical protein